MNQEIYGQLNSEKLALENQKCRQIVNEILDFGVNQRQLMMIIYLLSLNVENIETAQELSTVIKELSPEIFVGRNEDNNTLERIELYGKT